MSASSYICCFVRDGMENFCSLLTKAYDRILISLFVCERCSFSLLSSNTYACFIKTSWGLTLNRPKQTQLRSGSFQTPDASRAVCDSCRVAGFVWRQQFSAAFEEGFRVRCCWEWFSYAFAEICALCAPIASFWLPAWRQVAVRICGNMWERYERNCGDGRETTKIVLLRRGTSQTGVNGEHF